MSESDITPKRDIPSWRAPYVPAYEREPLTASQVASLRAGFEAEGSSGAYSVRMCDRALAGDISAINALKMLIYEAAP